MPGCTYTVGREAVCDFRWQDLPDYVAVDTEGAGKDGRAKYDLKCVQIGTGDHALIADPRDPAQAHVIWQIINSGRQLVFHNTPHDVPILYVTDLLTLESVWNVWDTLIWARGAEPGEKIQKNLRAVTNRYLGTSIEDPLTPILKTLGWSKARWYEEGDLNIPAYLHMAASDTIATARVWPLVRKAFLDRITTGHPFTKFGVTGAEAQRLVDREQVTNRPHLRRQCLGYLVDPEYLDEHQATVGRQMADLERQIEETGVRPGYSLSAVEYLDKIGELPEDHPRTKPSKTKPNGQWKSDADTLKALGHPFIRDVFLPHKKLEHDLAYLSKIMDNSIDGRIRPGTGMLMAATGRSSVSGDAPFQQFTAVARGIILADDWETAKINRKHPVVDKNGDAPPCNCPNPTGKWSIDWSQIEPTLVAYIARDTAATEYYEGGGKVYNFVSAAGINVSYKQTKIVLLGLLYGKGAKLLASELGCSIEEAKELTRLVWKALPGSEALAGRNGKLAGIAEKFQLIFTLSGRIVPVPSGVWPCRTCEGRGWVGDPDRREDCWNRKCQGKGKYWQVSTHKGINYTVQGGAYDLLAETEYAAVEAGYSDGIYLTMHDEMVVDAGVRHDIARLMQHPNEAVAGRLELLTGRVPTFRTDAAHLGERWAKV